VDWIVTAEPAVLVDWQTQCSAVRFTAVRWSHSTWVVRLRACSPGNTGGPTYITSHALTDRRTKTNTPRQTPWPLTWQHESDQDDAVDQQEQTGRWVTGHSLCQSGSADQHVTHTTPPCRQTDRPRTHL